AGGGKFCSKLFNATRFAMINGATVPDSTLEPGGLTPADRWILDRLDEVITQTTDLLGDFQFGKAAEGLYHFAWDEFCDWYLELAKIQIAGAATDTAAGADRVDTTRAVLGTVLDALLRLLHPFVPYVTETLWTSLTGGESLVIASWPQPSGRSGEPSASSWVADAQALVTEIRRFRADQSLAPSRKVPATLTATSDTSEALLATAAALTRLESADDSFSATAEIQLALSTGVAVTVRVDTSSTIDTAAEKARLSKDLAAAQKEIADTAKKLGNPEFIGKAPVAVVDKIRARAAKAAADADNLTTRLTALDGSVT
ncbi:MAG TPA: class I tRNA ligase family protein, partial [Nakamurella sp.]